MGRLEGKVAMVTGGARGQGRSHAVAFAREGADVVVCDIDQQVETVPYPLSGAADLEETARLVREQGRRCLAQAADVRDAAQVDGVVDAALAEFGRLDVLAANAGVWAASQLSEMSDELWRDVVEINLYGVFHAIRAVSRPMIEQGSGRIIATASTAARSGLPNMGPYVASKWGVLGLVKTAAMELGQHGITVNAVCPGAVESGMTTTDALYRMFMPEEESPTREQAEEIIRTTMHQLPVGWMGAQEITNVVVFLASDEARYISGTGIRRHRGPERHVVGVAEEETMGQLDGKVAFITGAARGRGALTRDGVRRGGRDLALIDLCADVPEVRYPLGTAEQLEETARRCRERGARVWAGQADVRDASSIEGAVARAIEELGRVDILINNAGISSPAGPTHGEEGWAAGVDINLSGVWRASKAVLPHMMERGAGCIIHISSAAGLRGWGATPATWRPSTG